jgi:hypothetical protein
VLFSDLNMLPIRSDWFVRSRARNSTVWNGNIEVVRLLLNAGACPMAERDHIQKTPIDMALARGRDDLLAMMLTSLLGMDNNEHIHEAAKQELESLLPVLVDPKRGYNVNATDECGRTALFYSVAIGNEQLTTSLLEKGANAQLRDKHGRLAIDVVQSHSMKYLLLKHDRSDHRDGNGFAANDGGGVSNGSLHSQTCNRFVLGRWAQFANCKHCRKRLESGTHFFYRKFYPGYILSYPVRSWHES